MEITPEIGIGRLHFGDSCDDLARVVGAPHLVLPAGEFTRWQYENGEIAEAIFRENRLIGLVVVPQPDTSLWSRSLYRVAQAELHALIVQNGHSPNFVPSHYPHIRDKIEVLGAGLVFFLENGVLDDLDFNPSDWRQW